MVLSPVKQIDMDDEVHLDAPEEKHTAPFVRELFGGAISFELPGEYEDISDLRQVPDNQEVYLDKYSNISVIVELFALEESVSGERIAGHYYEDIVDCNHARDSSVLGCVRLRYTLLPLLMDI